MRIGEYHRDEPSANARSIQVSSIIVHPGYRKTPVPKNDLALLALHENIEWSDGYRPICSPSKMDNYEDRQATVSGWGNDDSGNFILSLLLPGKFPGIFTNF